MRRRSTAEEVECQWSTTLTLSRFETEIATPPGSGRFRPVERPPATTKVRIDRVLRPAPRRRPETMMRGRIDATGFGAAESERIGARSLSFSLFLSARSSQ